MIEKFRRKFILYAMLMVFAILAVILSAVNIINFSVVTSDADNITQELANRGGSFDNPDFVPQEPNEGPGQMGPSSPETSESTRYFTFAFDKDGTATTIAFHISSFSETEAIEWAKSLVGEHTGWSKMTYRYRVYKVQKLDYVTVIDQSRELLPSYIVLFSSLGGSVVGLGLTFVILLLVSKRLIKPVEESYRKQKRFIHDASFALKDPLTIIGVNNDLEIMKNGDSLENAAISKQVEKLIKITTDLDELADLEKEKSIVGQEFDLSSLADSVSQKYKKDFSKAKKELRVEIAPGLKYFGKEEQIRQLFDVILDNALKFSKTNAHLTLSSKDDRIIILSKNDTNYALNNGPLDSYFERFERADAARKRGIPGSGIGLSIARNIVELHNGRIYISGENGIFKLKVEL